LNAANPWRLYRLKADGSCPWNALPLRPDHWRGDYQGNAAAQTNRNFGRRNNPGNAEPVQPGLRGSHNTRNPVSGRSVNRCSDDVAVAGSIVINRHWEGFAEYGFNFDDVHIVAAGVGFRF
jgi:hypothetical protein